MVASGTPCADADAIVELEKSEKTLVMKISENSARPIGTMARMAIPRCNAHAPRYDRGVGARLETLEDVIAAKLDIVDVIVQDEYTHDVIVRRAGDYLVFDTT